MAKSSTFLQITLYDPETNEVKGEYTRCFVPWKMLKKALGLARKLSALGKSLDQLDITELDDSLVDELAALVVEVFGDKFTLKDLDEGADTGEMLAVLTGILAVASGGPNPTMPGS